MKQKSFFDVYDELLRDRENWNYYSRNNIEVNSALIFEAENALYFIKNIFKNGGKEEALHILDDPRFPMTQYRSNHTLSAFLFGIVLRNELHIDMKELPYISNKPTKNFLYFWSLTCLFHDFSVAIEEKSSEILNDVLTLEQFKSFFEIEYSFVDASELGELVSNYYKYRIEQSSTVDHGIASAMIFFDSMMKTYNKAKSNTPQQENAQSNKSFEYNDYKFSEGFEQHIQIIANTIARHNMWVANVETEEIYKQYGLEQLIISSSGENKISIYDSDKLIKDKLLFLLGLVDTLEPIKILGRDRNNNPIRNPYVALERMQIGFYYTGEKRTIIIDSTERHFVDYTNSVEGIDDWMDLIYEREDNKIQITIINNQSTKVDNGGILNGFNTLS